LDPHFLKVVDKSADGYSVEAQTSMDQLVVNLAPLIGKPTGHSVYMRNVVSRLTDLGPTCLVPQKLSSSWRDEFGGKVIETSNNLSSDRGRVGHARRLAWTEAVLPQILRKLKADVLFSPIPEAPVLRHGRLVVTLYDFIPLEVSSWRSPLHQYFLRYVPSVLKRADSVLAISRATADEAIRRFQIPANRIHVTPLAHDHHHFTCGSVESTIESDPSYFLYVGRADAYKNVACALRALGQMNPPNSYELRVAGPRHPEMTPALERLARELGVRLRVLDYVTYDELPDLYRGAIALLFPSRAEGFGLPALEAMACGTPVIASDIPVFQEVIGEAGILCSSGDSQAFSRAMTLLAGDATTRREYQKLGLAKAEKYRWDRTAAITRDVLQTCMA
jgi:glycosyltransferase involved in cell wall biosynthesis